jgi:hypothetical protein
MASVTCSHVCQSVPGAPLVACLRVLSVPDLHSARAQTHPMLRATRNMRLNEQCCSRGGVLGAAGALTQLYCCVQYSSAGPYSMAGFWCPEALTYFTRAHALPGPALTTKSVKPRQHRQAGTSGQTLKVNWLRLLPCKKQPPDTTRHMRLLAALLALQRITWLNSDYKKGSDNPLHPTS